MRYGKADHNHTNSGNSLSFYDFSNTAFFRVSIQNLENDVEQITHKNGEITHHKNTVRYTFHETKPRNSVGETTHRVTRIGYKAVRPTVKDEVFYKADRRQLS